MLKRYFDSNYHVQYLLSIKHINYFHFYSSHFFLKLLLIHIIIKNCLSGNFPLINSYTDSNNGSLYKLELQPIDCTTGKAIIGFHLIVDNVAGKWAYEYACNSSGIYLS